MDKEQIKRMIERENLANSSNTLDKQLVRLFEELCSLEAELEGGTSRPDDLRLLETANRGLEQAILTRNTELVEVGKQKEEARGRHQAALRITVQNTRILEAESKSQREECKQLRATLDQMKNKSSEIERLTRRRNELQAQADQLQDRINDLGEEYLKNSELLQTLKPFVERMEQLEKQMEEIMARIWSDCKTDAFDRMF